MFEKIAFWRYSKMLINIFHRALPDAIKSRPFRAIKSQIIILKKP